MDTFIRAYTLEHWSTHVVTLIDARRSTFYMICLPAIEVILLSDPLSVPQYLRSSTPIGHAFAFAWLWHIQTYMHTYMHAWMHACLYTCMHARMHTCRHSYMQTCLHARLPSHTNIQKHRHRVRNDMHTCIPAYIRTCIHTHSFQKRGIQRYRQTQIHAWMIMDACKHGSIVACMHVYTVTHTQTYIYIYIHIACMSAWQSRAGVESRDAWMGRIHVSEGSCAVPVSAWQQERWWGCCACVCTGTWTLLSHPTPTHPTMGAQVSDMFCLGCAAQVSEISDAQVSAWPCPQVET